jgi:hypothetical protein
MSATVTTSASTTTATISDLTSSRPFTLTRSGPGAAPLKEEIIDDRVIGNAPLPVPNFGKIEFTSATVGGTDIGSVRPGTDFDMQTSTGVLEILTGQIDGSNEDSFVTTWKHS